MADGRNITPLNPLTIDYTCRHCGGVLAVVGERHDGVAIKGLRDLVYVHAETGQPTCTRTYRAEAFDDWAATRAFKKAQEARWAEEDAAVEASDAS